MTVQRSGGAFLGEQRDIVYFPLGAASYGGAERSILELAAAQRVAGKRVLICYEAALDAGDFVADALALGVPTFCVDWNPEQPIAKVFSAGRSLLRQLNTRILHFNISWRRHMWVIPLIARLTTRSRLIGTMRAMPEAFADLPHGRYFGVIPGPRIWAWPDFIIGRIWALTLHATVSVNRDSYPPRLVHAFGFSTRRLHVIYNGVPMPEVAPTPSDRRYARLKLGIGEEVFLVAYVGRVSPEKGVHYLIEAMTRCDASLQLVIAGDGSDMTLLQQQVEKSNLGKRVRFLGHMAPATPVYLAADVVVVPSLWNEAFGRVVVEAMACGSVVVATAVGGMQEIFAHRREGLLVPKADAAAISEALSELASEPALWRELSLAGYARALDAFSTGRVSAQYSALYASLG